MTASPPATLAHVTLLADRHKRLAGLAWSGLGPQPPGDSPAWLQGAPMQALASQVPCVVIDTDFDRWPDTWQSAATTGGLERVDAGRIARADSGFPAQLPLTQAWVAGNWYLQPPPKPNAAQTASRALALELVQLVASDADTRELEDVFRRDAALSYHLLRLVNSPAMGGQRVITSFTQAIMILGRQQLRRWLNLMLFAARQDDERAPMLMAHVSLRARCMELLAREAGLDRAHQEMAFMTGMFSMLGTLFGLDNTAVLQPLKLPEPMTEALMEHRGDIGTLLALLEAAEAGQGPAAWAGLGTLSLGGDAWQLALPQAALWMLDLTRANRTDGQS